jgi:cell division cycle 2-like protein
VKWKPSPSRLHELAPSNPLRAVGGGAWLSAQGLDLLSRLLALDPARRISCADALSHPYFSELPLACPLESMPALAPKVS